MHYILHSGIIITTAGHFGNKKVDCAGGALRTRSEAELKAEAGGDLIFIAIRNDSFSFFGITVGSVDKTLFRAVSEESSIMCDFT